MGAFTKIINVQIFDGFSIGVEGWVVTARLQTDYLDDKFAQMVYTNKEDAEKTARLLTNIMKELND